MSRRRQQHGGTHLECLLDFGVAGRGRQFIRPARTDTAYFHRQTVEIINHGDEIAHARATYKSAPDVYPRQL